MAGPVTPTRAPMSSMPTAAKPRLANSSAAASTMVCLRSFGLWAVVRVTRTKAHFFTGLCQDVARPEARRAPRRTRGNDQRMNRRVVAAALIGLLGTIWFFQGIGVAKGSFMTGHAIWSVLGVVLVLFAVALVRGARRS